MRAIEKQCAHIIFEKFDKPVVFSKGGCLCDASRQKFPKREKMKWQKLSVEIQISHLSIYELGNYERLIITRIAEDIFPHLDGRASAYGIKEMATGNHANNLPRTIIHIIEMEIGNLFNKPKVRRIRFK